MTCVQHSLRQRCSVCLSLSSVLPYTDVCCCMHKRYCRHRFDVYMQLRGLLACEYNPAAPLCKSRTAASGDGSSSSSTASIELLGYAEAQSAAFDALDSTAAFG